MDVSAYVNHLLDTHPGSSRLRSFSLSTPKPLLTPGDPRIPLCNSEAPNNIASSQPQQRSLLPYQRPRRHSQPSVQPITINQPSGQTLPENVQRALTFAWAPATRARYDVSVHEYLAFCDSERVPAADRLPASEMLLAMFAASLVGHIAGTTINAKLSTVRAWHIQNNQPWRGSILLQYVLKGAANATPDNSKQDRRLPITIDMLKDLYYDLDLTAHLDAAIYAVATMAFYGQLRLCEICSDREVYNTFNCKTLPNLSNLKPPHTPAGSRMLHLPWTKVKRNIGEDVAICSQRGVTLRDALLRASLSGESDFVPRRRARWWATIRGVSSALDSLTPQQWLIVESQISAITDCKGSRPYQSDCC